MKKPTDNIRHQLLKYLVDRANRTPSATTALLQYLTTPSTTLPIPVIDVPTTYADDAYEWKDPTEPSPAAVNLTIDNSITIIGDNNSLTLSSSSVASANTSHSTETNKVNDAEHDQEQMSKLAITLVNALKANGWMEERGCERPITIQLRQGVTLHGSDNQVVFAYPGGSPNLADFEDGDSNHPVSTASSVCFRLFVL